MLDKSNSDTEKVICFLKKLGYEITDYLDNYEIQTKYKVDFAISKKESGKKTTLVEFKSCSAISKTNNIAYEIISNFTQKKLGSCLATKAKFLFYYDNVNSILHLFDIDKLNLLISNSDITKWNVAKANTKYNNYESYCSFSLLIPLDFIKKHSKEIDYFKYEVN